jgi:putrescine aminotransferase
LGSEFVAALRQIADNHPAVVREVRGMGLLIGVEFYDEKAAMTAVCGMVRRGVLVAYTQNNPRVIRFEPPLVIEPRQLHRAADAFAEAVAEVARATS